MRKADYSLLADLVKQRETHLRNSSDNQPRDEKSAYAVAQIEIIACQFAQYAAVDEATFLKACGIKSN